MGYDFSALMRYGGPRRCRREIASFCRDLPAEFSAVSALWQEDGFHGLAEQCRHPAWIDLETNRQVKRPSDVDLDIALRTPAGFFIQFGRDAIYVYHVLRWIRFLATPRWQTVMLDACAAIARCFDAAECIIAHDCHPAMIAFHENRPFHRCFDSLGADEGEVEHISQLYLKLEDDDDPTIVMKPTGELVMRSRSLPLPPGWTKPTTWDSKGFWRFHWQTYETTR